MILFCDRDDESHEVRTCGRYIFVLKPEKAHADELIKYLSTVLKPMGIKSIFNRENVPGIHEHPARIHVPCGTDGIHVSVNV